MSWGEGACWRGAAMLLGERAGGPPATLASPCLEEPRGARARRRPGPREALGLSEAAAASGGRGRCGARWGGGCGRRRRRAGSRGPGPCAPVLRGAARGGGRQCVPLCRASARPLGRLSRVDPRPPRTSARSRTPPAGTAAAEKGVRAKPGGWHPSAGTRRRPAPSPSPASLRTSIPGRVTPTLPTDPPRRSLRCLHHHRPDPTFSPAYPTFAPSASPSPSPCAPHRAPSSPRPSVPQLRPVPTALPAASSPPLPAPAAAPSCSKPPFLLHQARFPRLRSR